jgi:hypothetical protein
MELVLLLIAIYVIPTTLLVIFLEQTKAKMRADTARKIKMRRKNG